ncbi:MAG: phage holin family protein [Bacteroidota bacterium]
MRKILLHWLILAGAVLLTAYFMPGFHVSSIPAALLLSFALGILNAVVRPILLFFTFPINFLTLGLFTWVINGLMLWLAALLVAGIRIDHFGWAILAALVISFVNGFLNFFFKPLGA